MSQASYPEFAWRWAMKKQEVILKAIAGEIKWIQAADILGVSPRTIRRLKKSYQLYGINGLIDQRTGRPSSRKISYEIVEQILNLFRQEYFDFNVAHFHEKLEQNHGIQVSYTWVKNLLQQSGYVQKGKGRGGHRKRRDRKPLFGQMLHLDGSPHEWLALVPGEKQVLLLVVDDATGKNLAGCLVEAESTRRCMAIMKEVVEKYGIPAQLYTDRDSVYWHTQTAGGRVDRVNLTQFGRAMEELGIEMIPGYSPQARGRSERWNGTWQGRLVAELRRAGIDNIAAANKYINEVFLPDMNKRFSVSPEAEMSAFVSSANFDLYSIFSVIHKNGSVYADNTVRVDGLNLQIEKSLYRISFAKCKVDIYSHLDKTYSVVWKKRIIGRYNEKGEAINYNGGQPPFPPGVYRLMEYRMGRKRKGRAKCPAHPYIHLLRRSGHSPV